MDSFNSSSAHDYYRSIPGDQNDISACPEPGALVQTFDWSWLDGNSSTEQAAISWQFKANVSLSASNVQVANADPSNEFDDVASAQAFYDPILLGGQDELSVFDEPNPSAQSFDWSCLDDHPPEATPFEFSHTFMNDESAMPDFGGMPLNETANPASNVPLAPYNTLSFTFEELFPEASTETSAMGAQYANDPLGNANDPLGSDAPFYASNDAGSWQQFNEPCQNEPACVPEHFPFVSSVHDGQNEATSTAVANAFTSNENVYSELGPSNLLEPYNYSSAFIGEAIPHVSTFTSAPPDSYTNDPLSYDAPSFTFNDAAIPSQPSPAMAPPYDNSYPQDENGVFRNAVASSSSSFVPPPPPQNPTVPSSVEPEAGGSADGFKCPVCPKVIKHKRNLPAHVKTHDPKDDPTVGYNCKICGRHYDIKGSLTRHIKRKHPDYDKT